MPQKTAVSSLENVQEWAAQRGPELLHLVNKRGETLTAHQHRELEAIKAICPCHWTDYPRQYASNGENCDICGRQM